jgi:hypothetical protein
MWRKKRMTILRHELEASCSPDRVWALLADLEAGGGERLADPFHAMGGAGRAQRQRHADHAGSRIPGEVFAALVTLAEK